MSTDKKTLIDSIIDRATCKVKASMGYEPEHKILPHATAFPFNELELWEAHRLEDLISLKRVMDVPMPQLKNMMLGIYDNHEALKFWSKHYSRGDDSYESSVTVLNDLSIKRLQDMLSTF
jgi:hypothetical protein